MWCGNADQLVVSRRYVIVNPEFLIESVWNISSVGQSHRLITGRSQVRVLDVPLQENLHYVVAEQVNALEDKMATNVGGEISSAKVIM